MAEGDGSNSMSILKKNMIERLVRSTAHFKHQQVGEPDLDDEEKSKIALDLLNRNGCLFLERFSNFLTLEDTHCFSHMKDDYTVDFYMKQIVDRHKDTHQNVIKNRRYQALQEMSSGDYFSMESMQQRDPLLFEEMVGQYETEEEQKERDIDKTDLKFSSMLLKFMDKQETKSLYAKLKEREEEQEEEEEETSDEEEEDEGEDKKMRGKKKPPSADVDNYEEEQIEAENEEANLAQKLQMRSEFVQIMQERFLSGEDSQFDYSKVDMNAAYDSLDILGKDEEGKYFDAEDPSEGLNDCDSVCSMDNDGEPCTPLRIGMKEMALDSASKQKPNENDGMDVDFMYYVPSDELVKQNEENVS